MGNVVYVLRPSDSLLSLKRANFSLAVAGVMVAEAANLIPILPLGHQLLSGPQLSEAKEASPLSDSAASQKLVHAPALDP